MATWIRLRYENGDSLIIDAGETYLHFQVEQQRIELRALRPTEQAWTEENPLCVYPCENADQVHAAEDLIFEALCASKSITISLDILEHHAEYLEHVHGIRTVYSLLHQGSIRVPVSEELPQGEDLTRPEKEGERLSEIREFEQMLHTYLEETGEDVLRQAYQQRMRKRGSATPFRVVWDHEECAEHGFHEYWCVYTQADRHYAFREHFRELARDVVEKEGGSKMELVASEEKQPPNGSANLS